KFSPADGNFLRYLKALRYFDPLSAGDTSLVEAESPSLSASESPSISIVPSDSDSVESDSFESDSSPLFESDTFVYGDTTSTTDTRSNVSKHIDRKLTRHVSLPASVKPLQPKPWASVGYELKALFFHLALRKQPYVRAFTLRLSEAVEKRARSQKSSPSRYLHKQLNQEIKRELERAGWASHGQQTPFWFVVEEDKSGRLHLHGEIAFDPAYRDAIRTGMKTAAGEWRQTDEDRTHVGKQHQLKFSRWNPDAGWAAYLCKCLAHATEPRRRYMTRFGSPKRWVVWYAGKPLSATDQLKREAAALYEQARAEAISATASCEWSMSAIRSSRNHK
ncbi:MAG: hypothetical protein J0H89_02110, partial [Rhizobiales bacterium]|nr:hypothetical protein [Hyphomicrobiales bacterium]